MIKLQVTPYMIVLERYPMLRCHKLYFNPFTPGANYGNTKVILIFESVDEILWCDHSNETSSAVLLHGTIIILSILQNEIWIRPEF